MGETFVLQDSIYVNSYTIQDPSKSLDVLFTKGACIINVQGFGMTAGANPTFTFLTCMTQSTNLDDWIPLVAVPSAPFINKTNMSAAAAYGGLLRYLRWEVTFAASGSLTVLINGVAWL